jgi:lipid-A-disaccharide synthase-like uncharacterized protein
MSMHGVPDYLPIGFWLVGFFGGTAALCYFFWWLDGLYFFAARAGIVERLG